MNLIVYKVSCYCSWDREFDIWILIVKALFGRWDGLQRDDGILA